MVGAEVVPLVFVGVFVGVFAVWGWGVWGVCGLGGGFWGDEDVGVLGLRVVGGVGVQAPRFFSADTTTAVTVENGCVHTCCPPYQHQHLHLVLPTDVPSSAHPHAPLPSTLSPTQFALDPHTHLPTCPSPCRTISRVPRLCVPVCAQLVPCVPPQACLAWWSGWCWLRWSLCGTSCSSLTHHSECMHGE